jgi:hypothetical protein
MLCKRHAESWRHPDRPAIRVGDFIDRAAAQVEGYRLVRAMVHLFAVLDVMGTAKQAK